MAKNYEVGLIIRGNPKGGVDAVRLTKNELDKLNRTQKDATKHSKQFGTTANHSFGSVAKSVVGVAAGVAGVSLGIRSLVNGFQEVLAIGEQYERMQLRTEALITATAGAAGLSSKALAGLADDVALNTLQSVEGVSKAINVMQTFKSVSGTTFKQSIALSADLATVMGGDITSSALQLGKALEDPVQGINSLRRAGVSFTADQKSVIKSLVETGDKAEAQKIILTELEKQVGGVGSAESKGLSGSYDTLSQKLDELALSMNKATGAGEEWKAFIDRMARGVDEATKSVKSAAGETDKATKLFGKALDLQIKIQKLQEQGTNRSIAQANRLRQERADLLDQLGQTVEAENERARLAAEAHQKLLDRNKAEKEAKEQASALAKQAIKDQEDFNFAVEQFDDAFAKVEQEIKDTEAAESKLRREREANIKTNRLYVESLEFEYELLQLTDKERYIQISLRRLNAEATEEEIAKVRELSGAMFDAQKEVKELGEEGEKAALSMQEAFGSAFQAISNEMGAFSGIANSLFEGLGKAQAGGGGFDITGFAKGLGPGLFASAISSSVGTILNDDASNARRRNNIGLLTGGLGFLLPSSIFGKPSDKTQSSQINLASGGISQGGFLSGSKFDQTNRDASDIAAQLLASISAELGNKVGQDLAGELDFIVGSRDGIRIEFNGEELVRSTEVSEALNVATEKLFELASVSSDVYRDLQQESESLAGALVRIDAQFETVTRGADLLGLQFDLIGDSGLTAADALVLAAGGLDAFIQGADYFYNNFFTQQERFNDLTASLNDAFADLNFSIPATRAEFKNLVLGLDLTTESGANTYAALIELAPSMDSYLDQLTEQKVTVDSLSGLLAGVNTELNIFVEKLPNVVAGLRSGPSSRIGVEDLGILGAITSNPLTSTAGLAANDDPVMHLGSTNQLYEHVTKAAEEYNEVLEEQVSNVIELIDYESLRADASRDLIAAYEDEAKELETLVKKAGSVAADLRAYSDSLAIGDLSSLSPEQQYAEAKRQFLSAKESGVGLKDASQAFLSESREFQGSAGSYASDFDLVRSTINATADLADRQKDTATKQLEQMERQVSEIVDLKKEVITLKEAMNVLTKVNQDAAQAQLTEAQKQTGALDGLKSNSDLQVSAA